MGDYLLHKAGLDYLTCQITAERARELYDEARTRPKADLDGDLQTGFHYWAISSNDTKLKLVHCHVRPMRDEPPQ